MSMAMCVLGSGSAGNSTLLVLDGKAMLIDAGFGPRSTPARLAGTGCAIDDLRAILLTHADRDHFNPSWYRTLLARGIAVYCHQRHRHALDQAISTRGVGRSAHRLHAGGLLRVFDDQPFAMDLGGGAPVRVRPIPLSHDRHGTCGFIIENGAGKIGYATDLGHVPEPLLCAMTDVHILAIESNYDRQMELASPRPPRLKQRIMGGKGHLSNDQTLAAVRQVFARSAVPPRHVVLLHLSRQCNDPRMVERLFATEPAIAERLLLTRQNHRTGWVRLGEPSPAAATGPLHLFA